MKDTTQIDAPAVLEVSEAVAEVAARLETAAGDLKGVAWLAVSKSEACVAALDVANRWTTVLSHLTVDVRALSDALYSAGTGFRTSDDAASRRLGAADGHEAS